MKIGTRWRTPKGFNYRNLFLNFERNLESSIMGGIIFIVLVKIGISIKRRMFGSVKNQYQDLPLDLYLHAL